MTYLFGVALGFALGLWLADGLSDEEPEKPKEE